MVACGSALAAFWLMWVLPRGIRTLHSACGHGGACFLPLMMAVVLVTVPKRGQQTVLAYAAPYFKFGYGVAGADQPSCLFFGLAAWHPPRQPAAEPLH